MIAPKMSRRTELRLFECKKVEKNALRDVTWVTINEINSGHWGVGGNALGLDDVKQMIASDEQQ